MTVGSGASKGQDSVTVGRGGLEQQGSAREEGGTPQKWSSWARRPRQVSGGQWRGPQPW